MPPTFTATIEQVNQTTSKATVRTHTVLVDRSVAKGGLDPERTHSPGEAEGPVSVHAAMSAASSQGELRWRISGTEGLPLTGRGRCWDCRGCRFTT